MLEGVPHFTGAICRGLTGGWISLLVGTALIQAEEPAARYRQVSVHVVNEGGTPMAGVKVQLLGLGRDALQAMDINSDQNLPGVWRFVSDAHGRCAVRFGCFKGFDSEKLLGRLEPGWGRFYFIAEAGRLRGVSACVVHDTKEEYSKGYAEDEWDRRGLVKTSDKLLVLTLHVKRGLRVTGRIIDTAGKPVRSFDLGLEQDLHSEHHTGYGNEIFQQSTASDEAGRFSFKDVFPNTFHLNASLDEDHPPVWVRTQVRGRWVPAPIDIITPRRGEKRIRLTLMVSPRLPYRYSGRILDEDGNAVPGAEMTFGVSRHRKSRTYEDDHHFLYTHSGKDGRFELLTATPFVRFVTVKAPGYRDHEEDYESKETMKAPGQWNITLRRR